MYELLILENDAETLMDEQGAYATMIVQFRDSAEQNEVIFEAMDERQRKKEGAFFSKTFFI
ncbi:hypothetical protein GCM10020331_046690 [Ectobacillus funiculus]